MITETDKLYVELDALRNRTRDILTTQLTAGYNLLANADDPQALLDKYGTDAAQYFGEYAAGCAYLATLGVTMPTPTEEWTVNPDGTVTYTAPEIPI